MKKGAARRLHSSPLLSRLTGGRRGKEGPPGSLGREGCIVHLEAPGGAAICPDLLEFQGWVAARDAAQESLDFFINGRELSSYVERSGRPDVQAAYRDAALVYGFVGAVPVDGLPLGSHNFLIRSAGPLGDFEVSLEFQKSESLYPQVSAGIFGETSHSVREARTKRLLPILRCPACGGELSPEKDSELGCESCTAAYPLIEGVPIMVCGEAEHPVEASRADSALSNNPLAPFVLHEIEKVLAAGGVVLEVGSGRKLFGVEQLVQLEICTYPFTDIVSQGEKLPFRDACFDCVVSLAVTEHVKRPWMLAAEMQRVLKPGGQVIVDSAFLQPLHGYPNHYFNMTAEGLRSIFEELEVEQLTPMEHQNPWGALEGLFSYIFNEAPPKTVQALQKMSVQEFWKEAAALKRGHPSRLAKLKLGEELQSKLAAGFTLLGRKRG